MVEAALLLDPINDETPGRAMSEHRLHGSRLLAAVPLNASGKVLKYELRTRAQDRLT